MCCLRFFKINANLGPATVNDFGTLSFLMGSLCVSLTSPATLEHLEIDIWFRSSDDDFHVTRFYEVLRGADAWSRLDSISSHPTGSRLQRVDITINYSECFSIDDYGFEDKAVKSVLDGLPLLRMKGILFVKFGEK